MEITNQSAKVKETNVAWMMLLIPDVSTSVANSCKYDGVVEILTNHLPRTHAQLPPTSPIAGGGSSSAHTLTADVRNI